MFVNVRKVTHSHVVKLMVNSCTMKYQSCKDCGVVVSHGWFKRNFLAGNLCNKHIIQRIKKGKGLDED